MSASRTGSDPTVLPTFDQFWEDAARRHGVRLPSLDSKIAGCNTIDDVIEVLKKEENAERAFREKGQKIRAFIRPFAGFAGLFIDAGAEAASASGVPGGKAVFSVFGVLLAATKGVTQVYDALGELLSKLQDFLGRLDAYLASPAIISPALKDILVKILIQLLDVLALFTKHLDKNVHRVRKIFKKRAKDYVKVLFGDTKVQDALSKLDKLMGEELQRSIAEVLVAAKTTAVDVKEMREEQQKAAEDVLAAAKTTAEDVTKIREELYAIGIAKWLSPPNAEDNHHRVSKSRRKDTGNWFFGSEFAGWKETQNGVFCIYGKVGSGKSVLFSSIVAKLEQEQELAYFYFDFRDPAKQTVHGLLTSLIFQLASRSPGCFVILKAFYEANKASLSAPNDDKLFECLEAMLRASNKVHILIDALDECPEDTRHQELLPLLKKIFALNIEQLRLLVTSRPETDVTRCMASILTNELSLHDVNEQANALARYVEDRLANAEDYPDLSEDLRSRARDVLILKADGMFLWADLVLNSLRHALPITVERELNRLPSSLNGVYERILEGIDPTKSSIALHIFECIAYATWPLSPEELADVFALDFETEDAIFEPKLRIAEPESSLLRTCSSIIQIVSEGSSSRVQFVHFSAQEYLSTRFPNHVATYCLNPVSAHTTLAKLCLSSLNSASSLLFYAVRNWMVHVQRGVVQDAVKAPLSRFLSLDSISFSRWIKEWSAEWRHEIAGELLYDEYTTPLYVATCFGLCNHIRVMLDTPGVDINAHRAPVIFAAVLQRNIEIADILLERGAAIDARSSYELTPLHLASARGELDIARFLLERGATVDARCGDERTPLHLATWIGHLDIASLLIERGAAVDAREENRCTPLHLALKRGHLEIARLLIERGADVNAFGENESSPLHWASAKGQLDIARLLIERGAAVDAREETECTPLHVAVWTEQLKIVRLLIERGATMDAREKNKRTPLHLAAQEGDLEIARLLIERGAAVDAREENECTPLHAAASAGKVAVVRLLVEHNALIDARNQDQSTPFYLAASMGNIRVLRYLSDRNATFEVCTYSGSVALHAAALKGRVNVIELLIELGADIEWRNHAGRTALLCAAGEGHSAAVRVLLGHGANIAACDLLGFSVLEYALVGGHVAVVQLLLERGANMRLENAPHNSCIDIAQRASKADGLQPTRMDWRRESDRYDRSGDVQDVARLLQEERPAIVRGDVVLRRLRRFRSVSSWGAAWKEVEDSWDSIDVDRLTWPSPPDTENYEDIRLEGEYW